MKSEIRWKEELIQFETFREVEVWADSIGGQIRFIHLITYILFIKNEERFIGDKDIQKRERGYVMKKIVLLCALSIIAVWILAACNNEEEMQHTSEKPTASEILGEDSTADIFQLNDTIYKSDVKWAEKTKVTKNKKVGEIKRLSSDKDDFDNGNATKLSKGTVIYSTKESKEILLVSFRGKLKKYVALGEG